MRAYRKLDSRGFTLVELMIVVAIIGVLAALAIYGVRRYLASAKTSEAKNSVGAISRGAAGAYERETAVSEVVMEGQSGVAASHAMCPPVVNLVPAGVAAVAGMKYQADSTPGTDYEVPEWLCLKFAMTQPQYYQYQYWSDEPPIQDGSGTLMAAIAIGDLDGDNTTSFFVRTGEVNQTTQTLRLATQVQITDEFE